MRTARPSQTPSPPPGWLAAGRIPALDGLRGLAVALVLLAHASQTKGFPALDLLLALGRIGPVGVDVFFVLSGFLITTLLCRERERCGHIRLSSFYLRRTLRIAPAYVCLLLCVGVLQREGLAHVPVPDWRAALTYTMNFRPHPAWELGHAWSLSIEEHFYLLWPLAYMLTSRRGALYTLLIVLALEPILRWTVLLRYPDWSAMTDLWTMTRLDAIAAGCLLALLAREAPGRQGLDRLARQWPVTLGLLVLSLALAQRSGKFAVGISPSVTAITLAALVWAAARRAPRWLEHPALSAVGIGSYSLYLWQQIFLNPHGTVWWTVFPINLFFAVLAAWSSYRMIELPFIQLKDRLGRRHARLPQTLVARPPGRVLP